MLVGMVQSLIKEGLTVDGYGCGVWYDLSCVFTARGGPIYEYLTGVFGNSIGF